jgi:archaellum component FlaC
MEQRIDRIEKAIEEMIESRKSDRLIIERLDKSIERHDKILANLESNQIITGKAMEGIHEDVGIIKEEVGNIKVEVSRLVHIVGDFMDAVGYKFKDHENRIISWKINKRPELVKKSVYGAFHPIHSSEIIFFRKYLSPFSAF